MEETKLALKRAGYETLEEFMGAKGISSPVAAEEALTPWRLGYDLWRVRKGDTFSKIARETGTTVSAIRAANPGMDPMGLREGWLLVIPFSFDLVPEDMPISSAMVGDILRGLRVRYPFLQVERIGKSVDGRPLWQARMGRGSRVVCYNAAHHANEWITTPVVLACLEKYAKAVAFGTDLEGVDAGALMDETTLHLVPMVNPDGVDLVLGVATEQETAAARAIGEKYPDIPFPQGWKANIRGTDLNLNYPAGWGQAREIKYGQGYTGPAPRDFVGETPLSEPESRAMFDLTEEIDPEITIAWHTQGREIYWQFLGQAPAGAEELGREMAEASGYTLTDTPYASGFAGYKDWFIQDFNRPGYTIEAGLGENPLPIESLPGMIRENLPIFLLGLTGTREEPESLPAWG